MNFLCQLGRNYENDFYWITRRASTTIRVYKFRPIFAPSSLRVRPNCIMKSVKLGILSRLTIYAPLWVPLTRFCDVSKRVVEHPEQAESWSSNVLDCCSTSLRICFRDASPNLIAASIAFMFWRLWRCFREHSDPFNKLRVSSAVQSSGMRPSSDASLISFVPAFHGPWTRKQRICRKKSTPAISQPLSPRSIQFPWRSGAEKGTNAVKSIV